MGKTVKRILKIGGGAALFLLAPQTTIFGNLLRAAGATLVGSTLGSIFRSKPKTLDQGQQLRLSLDPTAPRPVLYGKSASGGTLVYRETTGSGNSDLWVVIALAGHEITSFESFKWAAEPVTFSQNQAVGKFNGNMFLYEHLGTDSQAADTALNTASSKWGLAHKLQGVAYAVLKLVHDTDLFPQGFQNPIFTLKGRKVYDPRLDDTNGGSGPHRLADEGTWQWSENPVLCAADYLMGITVGGEIVAGMGISSSNIDWANIRAEAAICDEQVALKGGGTESRYTCNGWIDPRRTHRDNLEQISSAFGGTITYQSGLWRCHTAHARVADKVRNTGEVFGGLSMRAKKSISDKVNSIRGIYPDAATDYQLKDYPPLKNAGYIIEDGGQELWLDLNLPMTTSAITCQRLCKIALERARREKSCSLTFMPVALQDQAMDAVSFSYAPFNISNQKMLIADWALKFVQDDDGNTGFLITEELVEEDDLIYAWDETTDEQAVPSPGTVDRPDKEPDGLAGFSGNLDDISDGIVSGKLNLTALSGGDVDLAKAGVIGKTGANIIYTVGGVSLDSLKPVEAGANVTETRTALDVANVSGVAALTVKDNAQVGKNLTLNDGTVLHPSSILNVDIQTALSGAEAISSVQSKAQIADDLTKNNATKIHESSLPTGLDIVANNLTVQGDIVAVGGVAAAAWAAGFGAFQAGSGGLFGSDTTDNTSMTNNAYFDGALWKYIITDDASRLQQRSSELIFQTAGAGVAGGTITWTELFKVAASGNVTISNGDLTIGGNKGLIVAHSADTGVAHYQASRSVPSNSPMVSVIQTGALGGTAGNPNGFLADIVKGSMLVWQGKLAGVQTSSIDGDGNAALSGKIKTTAPSTTKAGFTAKSSANLNNIRIFDINNDTDVFRMGIEYNNPAPGLSIVDRNRADLLVISELTGDVSIPNGNLHLGASTSAALQNLNGGAFSTLGIFYQNRTAGNNKAHLIFGQGGLEAFKVMTNTDRSADLYSAGVLALSLEANQDVTFAGNILQSRTGIILNTAEGLSTTSESYWRTKNDAGKVCDLMIHGSATGGSLMGVTKSGYGMLFSNSLQGLLVNAFSAELRMGGNNSTGLVLTSTKVEAHHDILPNVSAAHDLGSSALKFVDGWFSGTVTAAEVTATSARGLKTNIRPISGALDRVCQLQGYRHGWTTRAGESYGLIQDEVQAVEPLLASGAGLEGTVNYQKTVPLLIEAIKELRSQVSEIRAAS